ncbi:MAG: phosphate signaling complex protein PhoU [Planctomycetia bacterium]
MAIHLLRDLDHLKKQVLVVGSLVEEATDKAISALVDRRPALAEEVLRGDDRIDRKEVEVEEECLKILALHQPVAADLRFIITVLKVNNDLERMGDLAVNVAERAAFLSTHEPLSVRVDFPAMGALVRSMLRDGLDALVRLDTDLARAVWSRDDEVDHANRTIRDTLEDLMQSDPGSVERALHTLSASRSLERMADHATNIAEDVLFMVLGEVARHRFRHYLGRNLGPPRA